MPAPSLAVVRQEATPDAVRRYLELAATVFRALPASRLEANAAAFAPGTRIHAAVDPRGWRGCLVVQPRALGSLQVGGVSGVCVHPESRGGGIGARLLLDAVAATRARYPALWLWTRIPGFFGRFGFRDAASLFEADPAGSSPMLLYHEPEARVRARLRPPLPRRYF